MRLFEVLAELVLLIHLLWILWVILGWILTRKRPLLRWFHIGSLVWGILTEVGPWPCPLTIAEQWLQRRAGPGPYQGSFLIHYLEIVIYPDVSQELLAWAGSSVCLLILGIHAWRFWQARQR
jgi:hypothetical protein